MIIGLDIGFGYTKSVADGTTVSAFPSVVGEWTAPTLRLGAGLALDRAEGLVLDGTAYMVGQSALAVSHRRFVGLSREWVRSPAYLALALTAIRRHAPRPGASVTVVTGLPVDDFDRMSDLVKAALGGTHKVDVLPDGRPWEVTVDAVRVLPQPLGTVFSMILDDRGAVVNHEAATGRIGVLDVGFRTCDYFTLQGYDLVPAECLTRNTGMADLLLDVGREIGRRWGLEVDPHDLDDAVLRGQIRVAGERVNIGAITGPLLERHAEAILAHARMIWGDGARRLDALWLTGGGAIVLPALRALASHAAVVPNPRIANAVGYYRYGIRAART